MRNRLGEILPSPQFSELHTTWVAASRERTWEALQATTLAEMPLARLLFALRSLPGLLARGRTLPSDRAAPVLDQFTAYAFTILAEEPRRELVLGLVAQPWRLGGGTFRRAETAADFEGFGEPGFVKAAVNFLLIDEAGGTRLTTETRVVATDPAARRKFARYWRAVRPGSGLVRRAWLRAIKRRSERGNLKRGNPWSPR